MNRLALILGVLTALSAFGPSAATAVSWHNTGSSSFTATGGPATFSIVGNNLTCLTSSVTGTAPPGSLAGSTYPMTTTTDYVSCSFGTEFHCSASKVAGTWTAGPPAVTSGIENITCQWRVASTGTEVCHVSGTRSWSYVNPNGAAPGRLTVPAGAPLTVTALAGGACGFLGATTLTWTEHTQTVTGGTPTSLGPVLTRTA